jgi:hypothetical protein
MLMTLRLLCVFYDYAVENLRGGFDTGWQDRVIC